MLAGLFLSKFDREGLAHLGFSSLWEAFNAIGYALGGKPTSVKNYMQEFDPLFPNKRQGWHKRELRPHCREAFERYGMLSLVWTPIFPTGCGPVPLGTPCSTITASAASTATKSLARLIFSPTSFIFSTPSVKIPLRGLRRRGNTSRLKRAERVCRFLRSGSSAFRTQRSTSKKGRDNEQVGFPEPISGRGGLSRRSLGEAGPRHALTGPAA